MKRHFKRCLELILVPFAAAVVFIEQTLIVYLNVAMAAIAAWPPIARFEAWLKRLPPWGALIAFGMPSLLILPVKLAALWFATHGRYGLALFSVILGKIVGTAILARLYRILRPTLMTMPWYARVDTKFFAWRDRAYAFVRALPAWQQAAALAKRLKVRVAELLAGLFAR